MSIPEKTFFDNHVKDQSSSDLIKARKQSDLKVIYKIMEDEIIIITCYVVKS